MHILNTLYADSLAAFITYKIDPITKPIIQSCVQINAHFFFPADKLRTHFKYAHQIRSDKSARTTTPLREHTCPYTRYRFFFRSASKSKLISDLESYRLWQMSARQTIPPAIRYSNMCVGHIGAADAILWAALYNFICVHVRFFFCSFWVFFEALC